MELLNPWVRSSNPSILLFTKTHFYLMATLDLFEISESEQGIEEWNLEGEGKRSGDHLLSLHVWPLFLSLRELAFLSAASAKEAKLWFCQSAHQAFIALQSWALEAVLKHLMKPQGPAFPGTGWLHPGGLQAAGLSTCHTVKLILKHPLMFYLSHQNN